MADIHAVARSFAATRSEDRLRLLVQQGEARAALLREEVEQKEERRRRNTAAMQRLRARLKQIADKARVQ